MAPLTLRLKAFLLRTILSLLTNLDLYLSTPLPNRPSFRRRIKATHASIPGSIDLLFYTPPSYKKPTNSTKSSNPSKSTNPTLQPSNPTQKHSLLINFHGGGFTLGTPQEDARFLTQAISSTGALAVSISYRLAPQHPFPTAIQDCISAILYLWSRAEELSIDPSRTVLSGFSAGGNLSWAVALKLCEEIERMRKGGEEVKGRIVGLVPFYGSVDWSKTRVERDASNPNLISVIPHWLFNLFDTSYLPPNPNMKNPLLSPGLAPDELLKKAIPSRVCMINCAGDQLLAEEEAFKTRLEALGKTVGGCVVPDVGHGFDKRPSFWRGDEKRDWAYGIAVKELVEMWR